MDIASIECKLTYGVPPLTHEECCWLFERAGGSPIVQPKRCRICEGDGKVMSNQVCPHCQGRGFEPRPQTPQVA